MYIKIWNIYYYKKRAIWFESCQSRYLILCEYLSFKHMYHVSLTKIMHMHVYLMRVTNLLNKYNLRN